MFHLVPSFFLSFFFVFSFPLKAKEFLSLSEALKRGVEQNGELLSWKARLRAEALQEKRVKGEFAPKINVLLGIGPTTGVRGNALSSVEQEGRLGSMFLGRLEFSYALLTWGREKDYLQAAKAAVRVKKEEKKASEQKLRYEIKESYYGVLYAKSLLDLAKGVRKEVSKMLKQQKDKEARYRLKILQSQLEMEHASLEKGFRLAKSSFFLRLGAKGKEVLPKEDWLEEQNRKKEPLSHYEELFFQNRPEFSQLDAGILAKDFLASAENKGKYPVLAILARYTFAHTGIRERQKSIFAYDPYNRDDIMFGLGIRWDFQWGLQKAKASKLSAEAEELRFRRQYAKEALFTLLKKAYWELEETEKRLKAAKSAWKNAKRWSTHIRIVWSSGLGEKDALVESYKAKVLAEKNYYESLYKHHMAWAKLSFEVGAEVDPLLP